MGDECYWRADGGDYRRVELASGIHHVECRRERRRLRGEIDRLLEVEDRLHAKFKLGGRRRINKAKTKRRINLRVFEQCRRSEIRRYLESRESRLSVIDDAARKHMDRQRHTGQTRKTPRRSRKTG